MHVMVVRRSILEAHPSLAPALMAAFAKARDLAMADLEIEQAPKVMLPWTPTHLEQTRGVMGHDFWPYGVRAGAGTGDAPENRRTVETQIGWAHAQGLIDRPVPLDEFFAPGALQLARC